MTPSQVLKTFKKICVVGLSPDPSRVSHSVSSAMALAGFEITGVNPTAPQVISNWKVYPTLSQVPGTLEIVNVFRQPSAIPALVDELIPLQPKVLWLQEGVYHPEAEEQARQAGIVVVSDTCIWKILARSSHHSDSL